MNSIIITTNFLLPVEGPDGQKHYATNLYDDWWKILYQDAEGNRFESEPLPSHQIKDELIAFKSKHNLPEDTAVHVSVPTYYKYNSYLFEILTSSKPERS